MKVLLIFAPVHPKIDSLGMKCMPPLAVYYLASILESNGHIVTTLDPHYFKERKFFDSPERSLSVINEVLKEKYDVVGISSNTGNWGISLQIAQLIKEVEPKIPIIAGGVHPSYFHEYIVRTTVVDYVVRGEGEVTLVRLLDSLNDDKKLSELQGITYKSENGEVIVNPNMPVLSKEELIKYPLPDYSRVPQGVYPHMVLETSRGCRFSCIFCSVVHRNSWRGYSEDVVVERVKNIAPYVNEKTVNTGGSVYFVDDCFTADTGRAANILERLDKANLGLQYAIECRVTDLLVPGFIDKIPPHLISGMQIGIEAGYDEGLRKIRKGVTVKQLEECAALLSTTELISKAQLSFIVGFPWETEEDMLKTIHMAGYLADTYGLGSNINWLWFCPSDLWKMKEQYNINVDESIFDDPLWLVNYDTFSKSHPNITPAIFERIEHVINTYKKSGCEICYTTIGNEW